jgi:hypothetical protein
LCIFNAHFHSGKFTAERKFYPLLTMIFLENFLSAEIYLEWKWAFKGFAIISLALLGYLEILLTTNIAVGD